METEIETIVVAGRVAAHDQDPYAIVVYLDGYELNKKFKAGEVVTVTAQREYETVEVRSDDAAKWIGRDGWELHESVVVLRRPKPN